MPRAGGGIQIEGVDQLVRLLTKYGVEASDLKAAFTKVGQLVVDEAQAIGPKVSGDLVGSLRPSKAKNKSIVRAGSARIPYAGVIHYGWPAHGIEANPFLETAVENVSDAALRLISTDLGALIRRVGL